MPSSLVTLSSGRGQILFFLLRVGAHRPDGSFPEMPLFFPRGVSRRSCLTCQDDPTG